MSHSCYAWIPLHHCIETCGMHLVPTHTQAVQCRSPPAKLHPSTRSRHVSASQGHPAADTTAAVMSRRGALVWLRNDLRVTDHEGLTAAAAEAQHLSAVYCLDDASMAPRRSVAEGGTGLPMLGPHRLRWLLPAHTSAYATFFVVILCKASKRTTGAQISDDMKAQPAVAQSQYLRRFLSAIWPPRSVG